MKTDTLTRPDIHNADVPVLCRACEARHKGICNALDQNELLRLGRGATRRKAEPGAELVAAGVPTESYAIILSGVVKLTKLMPDGRQQIVGLQFAPDFLGRPYAESSVVTAEAATSVGLCVFPRHVLEDLVRRTPALGRRLHLQALRELDEARDWMMTLGQKSAGEKVASFLLLLSRHIDPIAEGYSLEFEIPLKRADIADFLGLTIETVSRHLTRLRKAGVITIESNRLVSVNDMAALSEAAGA